MRGTIMEKQKIAIELDRYDALIRKEQLLELVATVVATVPSYDVKTTVEKIIGRVENEQH